MTHSREIPELEQIPQKIRPTSSNLEVKWFLYNQLLKDNDNLVQHSAYNMVKNFKGDGEGVFLLPEEQSVAAFNHTQGTMLYHKIEQEKKDSKK